MTVMTKITRRPTKYKRGKIYKIVSDNGLVYFGSTIRSLKSRFKNHKYHFEKCTFKYSSWKVFQGGNAKIELVEKFPCRTRRELEVHERFYIENYDCVNIYLAGTWTKKIHNKNGQSGEVQLSEVNQEGEEINDCN